MVVLHRVNLLCIGVLNSNLLPGSYTPNSAINLPIVFIYSNKWRRFGESKTFLHLDAQVGEKLSYMRR